MKVTLATPRDASRVLALRESIADWLVERGVRQWLPGSLTIESLEKQIGDGAVFVVYEADELIGSITVTQADESIWGKTPDDADYVHRLMVDRRWAGRGVGDELLRWAKRRAEESGRPWLRLDCWEGSAALRAFYESAGFECVGRRDVAGLLPEDGAVVLFEQRLSPSL